MILNPRKAIEEGWIKNYGEECIQPNSIDVRLNKLFAIEGILFLGVDKRDLPEWEEQIPDRNNFFFLAAGRAYQFECLERVEVPENVIMRLYMRSTLNRSGVFVGAGLWDTGFKNFVGASFYPFCSALIEKGARIAQVVFIKASSAGFYRGQYGDSQTFSGKDT